MFVKVRSSSTYELPIEEPFQMPEMTVPKVELPETIKLVLLAVVAVTRVVEGYGKMEAVVVVAVK